MNAVSLQEDRLVNNAVRGVIFTSGAANTCAIEYTPVRALHGGRETDLLEQAEDGKLFLYLKRCGGPNEPSLTEANCQWLARGNRAMISSVVLSTWLAPSDFVFQSPIALSRGFLIEDCSETVGAVCETTYSASAVDVEQDFRDP